MHCNDIAKYALVMTSHSICSISRHAGQHYFPKIHEPAVQFPFEVCDEWFGTQGRGSPPGHHGGNLTEWRRRSAKRTPGGKLARCMCWGSQKGTKE
eukprot:1158431-Pelagomonas_calceolata.AAC.2